MNENNLKWICITAIVTIIATSTITIVSQIVNSMQDTRNNSVKMQFTFKGNNSVNVPIGELLILMTNATYDNELVVTMPQAQLDILKQMTWRYETNEITVTIETENLDQLLKNIASLGEN